MRKQITPKKRFQVLERDGFKCRYCGCDATTTVLEIDHIIPVKEGGTNKMDNLLTSCHKCNRGKGSRKLGEKKYSYKVKIGEAVKEAKADFYTEWNKNIMGTIDKKTQSMLSLYISDFFNNYSCFLNYKKSSSFKKYYSKEYGFDYDSAEKEFQSGGKFCDEILEFMSGGFYAMESSDIIQDVFDNDGWNWDSQTDYTGKLNYYLTFNMAKKYKEQNRLYVLYKFSLFHKLLDDV